MLDSKFIILTLFLGLSFISLTKVNAQKKFGKVERVEIRADRLYDDFSYIRAREVYKRVVEMDSENDRAILRVAECYLKLNKPDKAEEWYSKLSKDFINQSSYDLIKFGESLLKNKKYIPAKEIYEAVTTIAPDDVRASNLLKGIESIDRFFIDSLHFQISEVNFNTEQADFSPAYYNDGLVFVSARDTKNPIKYIYNWDHTNYLDLYYVRKEENGRFTTPARFSTNVNTKYHEGPVSFFNNDQQVIFTRNNYYNGSSNLSEEGVNRLQLFQSRQNPKNGKWSKPELIDLVTKEYSAGHPTVTSDGKRMYFASNIPGGQGQVDIYYADYLNGRWRNPQNLGSQINTNGNEMFPFIASDSVLYFASDGQPGIGGLDIFRAEFLSDGTISVKNMGYPLNTNLDDFGLIVSGDRGYFSSNRMGQDDIYEIFFNYTPVNVVLIDSLTGQVLSGTIEVQNKTQNQVVTLVDIDDKKVFDAVRDISYKLSGSVEGYTPKSIEFVNKNIPYNNAPHQVEIPMVEIKKALPPPVKEEGVILAGTLYNETTKEPIPGRIFLSPNFTEKGFEIDSSGQYSVKIPENGMYLVEGKSAGYFSKTDSIYIKTNESNRKFVKDIYLKQAVVGAKIRLNRVFFDFDKATLRPISMEELDKIVVFMKENPSLLVEIGGHTDNRGSAAYNKALSGRRAASVMNYLISKGINIKRMTSIGYGLEQPEVPNDSDYNRQLNRRVEFKITGIDYEYRF